MKRMARAISKKISKDNEESKEEKDPREEYKKKRELLMNPPKVEEPEINLVDDQVTNVPFESILSELDIVNMHVKKDYEENLLKNVLKTQENAEEESDHGGEDNPENDTEKGNAQDNECKEKPVKERIPERDKPTVANKTKKPHKRKHSPDSEIKVENVVAVKKVKKKKHKRDKEKEKKDDDDYVLSKLFAKANVRSALHSMMWWLD